MWLLWLLGMRHVIIAQLCNLEIFLYRSLYCLTNSHNYDYAWYGIWCVRVVIKLHLHNNVPFSLRNFGEGVFMEQHTYVVTCTLADNRASSSNMLPGVLCGFSLVQGTCNNSVYFYKPQCCFMPLKRGLVVSLSCDASHDTASFLTPALWSLWVSKPTVYLNSRVRDQVFL